MHWQPFLPEVFILGAAALAAGFTAWAAWKRRATPGARLLALAMWFVVEWALAGALAAAAPAGALKATFTNAGFVGFAAAPVLTLMFVLIYTRRARRFSTPLLVCLWGIPVLTIVLALTNDLHHLMFTATGQGMWFWVHMAFTYLLYSIIVVMLIGEYAAATRAYRLQIGMMAVASIGPELAGLLFVTGLSLIPGMEWTPVGSAIAGLAYVLAMYRFRFFDLVPVAREALVEQMRDGVVVVDAHGKIIDLNAAAKRLLKNPGRNWLGTPFGDLFPAPNRGAGQELATTPVEFMTSNDPQVWLEVRYSYVYDHGNAPVGTLVVLRDITRRKHIDESLREANQRLHAQLDEINHLKDQLREQAIRDALTGLFNRRYLEEMLDMALSRARREDAPASLLMLDIDHFKEVNDHFGHPNGDLILQGMGEFIRQNIRHEDIACRYGGEEFIVVMPGANAGDASERGEELRQGFGAMRFVLDGQELAVTFSVGVASYPRHAGDVAGLLQAADRALYQAKALGRNRVEIYSE